MLPMSFLQRQRNISFIPFPAFSPLIIIFVSLKYTLKHLDSKVLFKALVFFSDPQLTHELILSHQLCYSGRPKSKALSKSTNPNFKFFTNPNCKFFLCEIFPLNSPKLKMAFVLPYPGKKPNCISNAYQLFYELLDDSLNYLQDLTC